jgi:predicted CXXCH cytochrome family protein
MSRKLGWLTHAAAAALCLVAVSGCVDEKIVYRNGPIFSAPVAAASGFLGYNDEANKQTVCGSCHAGQQAQWTSTAHASAWKDLQASGHAVAACENCHAVGAKGNLTTADGGWATTKDKRYHDVQCESCHGPGLEHVSDPSKTQPIVSLKIDTSATPTTSCAECHHGEHTPFVEEWKRSNHATMATSWSATGPQTRDTCQSCHVGQAALKAFGATNNYKEKDLTKAGPGDTLKIVCAVCHDPHFAGNPKQLRRPVDSPDPNNNLCMTCHNRNTSFSQSSTRGPHAPEGPTVLGFAGWWPPSLLTGGNTADTLVATHGSDRNPRLCAGCHVQNYAVTDKVTGAFKVQVVGHEFLAIPCVDANGEPTVSQTCATSARSFKSCSAAGCHTESSARSALTAATANASVLLGTLRSLIAQVPCSQFATTATNYTARGARFNYMLVTGGHGTLTDPGLPACPSSGPRTLDPPVAKEGQVAHNPFLIQALLSASILELRKQYALPLSVGVEQSVEATLAKYRSGVR